MQHPTELPVNAHRAQEVIAIFMGYCNFLHRLPSCLVAARCWQPWRPFSLQQRSHIVLGPGKYPWHAVSGKLPPAQTTSLPLMCIKLTTASGCQNGLYQVSQNPFRTFRLVVTVTGLPVMLLAHVLLLADCGSHRFSVAVFPLEVNHHRLTSSLR